jgi:hypothetical protein
MAPVRSPTNDHGLELIGGTDGIAELGDTYSTGGFYWYPRTTQRRPAPRHGHAMVYDRANRRCIVVGGYVYWSASGADESSSFTYDGSTWAPFVGLGDVPPWRWRAAACYDEARSAMVLFGGSDWQGSFRADTHVLSSQGEWISGSNGPSARAGAAMVYVVNQQRALLFGGEDASTKLGDTWTYDLGTDQWLQGPSGPPARSGHGMAYDRLRDRVVLFGGRNATPMNDTWEFQAATGWVQRTPLHQPPPRYMHMMAFDEGRGRTVVCGGLEVSTTVPGSYLSHDDLWEWDGNDWTQRQLATVGNGKHLAAMVYDPDRARLLYFGGGDQYNVTLSFHEISDEVTEIDAIVDTAGPGNTAAPEALRCYSQPVLGQPLRLGFSNPQGFGFHTIGFGPLQQPLGPLPVPPLCEPSSIWATLASHLVLGTSEPNISWNVPNTPLILGVTLVFQAFAAQPASCWRATDALHVRF